MFENAFKYITETGIIVVIIRFAIILVATIIVAHLLVKLTKRITQRDGSPLPSSSIFVTIVRVFVWACGIGLILQYCLGISATGFIAALGVGGVALSLGMQDTLSNLIGGLQVSNGKLVQPGDWVEFSGVYGQVEDVTWRHTTILDESGVCHCVPNSQINNGRLAKYGDKRTVDTPFVIPPGQDWKSFQEEATHKVNQACGDLMLPGTAAKVLFTGSVAEGMKGVIRLTTPCGVAGLSSIQNQVSLAVADLIATRNPHITY